MEHTGHGIFGHIPEDIGRLIFEIVTEEDNCRPAYALISKQVQRWVEPVVYRDVVASTRFHRTVVAPVSSKPPNFFALHVKSLAFFFGHPECWSKLRNHGALAADILERCTSVQSLALWYTDWSACPVEVHRVFTSPLLSPPHLSLSVVLPLNRIKFSDSIFARVTHLDLSCSDGADDWPWNSLRSVDYLTHLNVDAFYEMRDAVHLARTILSSCPPSLRVLIITVSSHPMGEAIPGFKALSEGDVDPRALIAVYKGIALPPDVHFNLRPDPEAVFRTWSTPSKGNTFWEQADQAIQTRQRRIQEKAKAQTIGTGGDA
ncbi:hypothetical protein NMY22_g867 [Coprinellus aureogranulatus]|nr:hypothetical protein NMY22_g867 [Coprinellus aureogranulatus]